MKFELTSKSRQRVEMLDGKMLAVFLSRYIDGPGRAVLIRRAGPGAPKALEEVQDVVKHLQSGLIVEVLKEMTEEQQRAFRAVMMMESGREVSAPKREVSAEVRPVKPRPGPSAWALNQKGSGKRKGEKEAARKARRRVENLD